MSKILSFPQPHIPPESRENFEQKIHLLAQNSNNIFWDNPHVQLRMKERKVTIRQILDVGSGREKPSRSNNSNMKENLTNTPYHYSECGLENIYLSNGFAFIETPRGRAVSINDIDGLHKAIGKFLITSKKDLNGEEIRFLRHELLMSQKTLAQLLGVAEQTVLRWENGKTTIPKPSEALLRLLYHDHLHNKEGNLSNILKAIASIENELSEMPIYFKDTRNGWTTAA